MVGRSTQIGWALCLLAVLIIAGAILSAPTEMLSVHFDTSGKANSAASRTDFLIGHVAMSLLLTVAAPAAIVFHPKRNLPSYNKKSAEIGVRTMSILYGTYVLVVVSLLIANWDHPVSRMPRTVAITLVVAALTALTATSLMLFGKPRRSSS